MASGWTNRGRLRALEVYFRNGTEPTNFFLALFTAAATPTADTNVFSDLTEIATGNGYSTGGVSVARNSTDFDVLTEDDSNDRALTQLKDEVYTASGGTLPASGSGASFACLTDDNVTVSAREVVAFFDLVSPRQVSDGQALTLQNCELRAA